MPTNDKKPFTLKLSLAQWIKIITFLSALIKAVAEMVKEVEQPGADGPTKKAAVMAFLETLIDQSIPSVPELEPIRDAILDIAGHIIDGIVAAFNVIGKFIHKDK